MGLDRGRQTRQLTLSLLALSLAPGYLMAQKLAFKTNPRISVGYFITDNVNFVGEEAFDGGLALSLGLGVEKKIRAGSWTFSYAPNLTRYGDFEDLDFNGHFLNLGLNYQPSPRSSLQLSAGYFTTQNQGNPRSVDSVDFFLNRRTRREGTRADVAFGQQMRNRWKWNGSVGLSSWSFEEIMGSDPQDPQAPLEDRKELRGSLSVGRALSRRTTLGVRYNHRRFDLDLSGEEESNSLSLHVQRRVSEDWSLGFSLGAFRRDGEGSTGSQPSQRDSRTGADATLSFFRQYRRARLSISASHIPSAGGSRRGTSTNSAFGVSIGGIESRRWIWGIDGRYANRDPSDPSQESLDSISIGARLEVRFARYLGVGVDGWYVDQSSDMPGESNSYYRAGLSLVAYPLGWARLPAGLG